MIGEALKCIRKQVLICLQLTQKYLLAQHLICFQLAQKYLLGQHLYFDEMMRLQRESGCTEQPVVLVCGSGRSRAFGGRDKSKRTNRDEGWGFYLNLDENRNS